MIGYLPNRCDVQGQGACSTVVGIICPPGWDKVNCSAKNWGAKAPPASDSPARVETVAFKRWCRPQQNEKWWSWIPPFLFMYFRYWSKKKKAKCYKKGNNAHKEKLILCWTFFYWACSNLIFIVKYILEIFFHDFHWKVLIQNYKKKPKKSTKG